LADLTRQLTHQTRV